MYVLEEYESRRAIYQPSRFEVVGKLVGAVPMENGSSVTVDVAARSVSEHDGLGVVGLDVAENGDEYGRAIVPESSDEHAGKTVTKSGRTADVTTANVELINVTITLDYALENRPESTVSVGDCVQSSLLGEQGDSGSAVYSTETGALSGLVFAGTCKTQNCEPGGAPTPEASREGYLVQFENIRKAFGIEPITDWDARSPGEYGRPTSEEWPITRQGDRGENVKTVQYLPREHGFSLTPDGTFGPQTADAAREFQENRSSSIDGIVGRETWGRLIATVKRGDSGHAVRAVQERVGTSVDGVFGPQPESKGKEFRSGRGLAADGVVGENT